MDAHIMCFKHCGSRIFCYNVPEICPACGKPTSDGIFREIPFRIPYPFVKSDQHPCAVVMKPTQGNFLDDYHNSDDLHIGVTDSRGTVYEYDSNGLRNHRTMEWNQSILIYEVSEAWMDHWDHVLREVSAERRWTPEKYDQRDHNCYNFVLAFLQRLDGEELRGYVGDKQKFCENFVVSKSSAAGSYITLYRKVKKDGYFIENN